MAQMKPSEVDTFQNSSEKKSYKLLESLDDTFTVVYEPSIGLQKRRTPDFILISKNLGLIILDVKYVKLDNIQKSNSQTIIKKDGTRMKNFYQIVKGYAYDVNNQFVNEFKDNTSIVHPSNKKNGGKLTFPHSSGLLLFVHNAEQYTKEDVAKILSLHVNDFLIVNTMLNNEELLSFLKKLNRPFSSKITDITRSEILKKLYIDSDASSTDFINTMSKFNLSLNNNFKESLTGTQFEKSKQLKINLLEYTKFSQRSIETADKNLGLGCENIIEELKGYKQILEDEKFTVAVFGYFSTGKSTFLNALMNTDKLPMDEDRSTATFTRLRHCDESEEFNNGDMQVIYKDENDISIAYKEAIAKLPFNEMKEKKYINFNNLNEFKNELLADMKEIKVRDFPSNQRDSIKNSKKIINFVTENQIPYGTSDKVEKEDIKAFLTDDRKALGISEVIYYLDNDLLKDIEIVDTPGYGSENTMDTLKTQEFIQEANVLILLTEAKDPMSKEDEHKFLETYEGIYKQEDGNINTENLFIIANKADESSKTIDKIKDSIVDKIEDNWEDSLVLNREQIYTMSSKYHYDKNMFGKSSIASINLNEDDLNKFIDSYSKFLTENKDKEFVTTSFRNIDHTISTIKSTFNSTVNDINKSIEDVQRRKKLFIANKSGILKNFNLYSKAISQITVDLHHEIIKELDKQKLNDAKKIENSYIKFLKNKGKNKNDATKEYSKDFYEKFTRAIYKELSERNIKKLLNSLSEIMGDINNQIKKYSEELEEVYGINNLDKEINASYTKPSSLGQIQFEKGFVNGIIDIVTFGLWVDTGDYSKQMEELWKEETYSMILKYIDNYNDQEIKNIQKKFKDQNDDIVNSIGQKLNAIEKRITARQKDREEYNQKIEKMESTFARIDKTKDIIQKQVIELYS